MSFQMDHFLSRLRLRHLRLIRAINDTGQLSLAAQALAITQPAASRSLGDLEKIVGDALFERLPTGMVPTRVGALLVQHATMLLGQLESAVSDVEDYRQGVSGAVRVGAVTGPAVRYLVPAIQKLKQSASTARISVEVTTTVELIAGLLHGDFDIVLCRVPPDIDAGQLDLQRGRVEVIQMVTRRGHPLQTASNVSFEDLQPYTWVIQSAGMPIRNALAQAFTNRNLSPPEDTVDTTSLLMALSYLKSSDAIAAMTEEVAGLVTSDESNWKTLPMQDSVVLSPYHLVMRRGVLLNPICMRLRDLLQSEIAP